MTRRLLITLVFGTFVAALFVVLAVQKQAAGQNGDLVAETDSRLVDVEKACKVDEITIDDLFDQNTGQPKIVERGNDKNDCKKKLVNTVYNLANAECMLYTKIEKPQGGAGGGELRRQPAEECHASRGNLNPSKHFGFIDDRTCYLAQKVDFTCN